MSDILASGNAVNARVEQFNTDTAIEAQALPRVIRTVIGADNQSFEEDVSPQRGSVPASTAYPHLFDVTQAAGRAMQFVSQSLQDAEGCLEDFGEGDLSAVQTRLGLVATQLAAAYPLVDFNRDFSNVLAFLRRAILSVSAVDVDREMLNGLVTGIRKLIESPTISLMDAAKLTRTLENQGWNGSHRHVEELLRALLSESDAEHQAQGDMFEDGAVEIVRS